MMVEDFYPPSNTFRDLIVEAAFNMIEHLVHWEWYDQTVYVEEFAPILARCLVIEAFPRLSSSFAQGPCRFPPNAEGVRNPYLDADEYHIVAQAARFALAEVMPPTWRFPEPWCKDVWLFL